MPHKFGCQKDTSKGMKITSVVVKEEVDVAAEASSLYIKQEVVDESLENHIQDEPNPSFIKHEIKQEVEVTEEPLEKKYSPPTDDRFFVEPIRNEPSTSTKAEVEVTDEPLEKRYSQIYSNYVHIQPKPSIIVEIPSPQPSFVESIQIQPSASTKAEVEITDEPLEKKYSQIYSNYEYVHIQPNPSIKVEVPSPQLLSKVLVQISSSVEETLEEMLEETDSPPCKVDKSVQVDRSDFEDEKGVQTHRLILKRSKAVQVKSATREQGVSPLVFQKEKAVQVRLKGGRGRKAGKAGIGRRKRALSPLDDTFKSPEDIEVMQQSKRSRPTIKIEFESTSSDCNTNAITSGFSYDDSLISQEKSATENKVFWEAFMEVVEQNPMLFLGLPPESYYLVNTLEKNVHNTTMKDIFITLQKCRFNDSFEMLSTSFDLEASAIREIFRRTVCKMAPEMKRLILSPCQDEIRQRIPSPFRARYGRVVSIISFLEIGIEKPKSSVQQSVTWSGDKECNTIKYLVSYTPDGLINFVSNGYGGHSSDLDIVKDCGYLNTIKNGMSVMVNADSSGDFNHFSPLIKKVGCKLVKVPSIATINKFSSKKEERLNKSTAAVRSHVGRVIERLQEFHILQAHACIENEHLDILDDIVVIACAIVNMHKF